MGTFLEFSWKDEDGETNASCINLALVYEIHHSYEGDVDFTRVFYVNDVLKGESFIDYRGEAAYEIWKEATRRTAY